MRDESIELIVEQLRRTVDPASLGLETTEHEEPLSGVIGQDRATAALELGIGMPDEGFNIYVSGLPGIGKMTAVKAYLEKIALTKDTPPDWCYVNNFEDPYLPQVITLP